MKQERQVAKTDSRERSSSSELDGRHVNKLKAIDWDKDLIVRDSDASVGSLWSVHEEANEKMRLKVRRCKSLSRAGATIVSVPVPVPVPVPVGATIVPVPVTVPVTLIVPAPVTVVVVLVVTVSKVVIVTVAAMCAVLRVKWP